MSVIGWKITKEHLGSLDDRIGRGLHTNLADELYTYEWITFDDDNTPCFEGVATAGLIEGDESVAFLPLDYSTADVGATRMDYRRRGSSDEWKTL